MSGACRHFFFKRESRVKIINRNVFTSLLFVVTAFKTKHTYMFPLCFLSTLRVWWVCPELAWRETGSRAHWGLLFQATGCLSFAFAENYFKLDPTGTFINVQETLYSQLIPIDPASITLKYLFRTVVFWIVLFFSFDVFCSKCVFPRGLAKQKRTSYNQHMLAWTISTCTFDAKNTTIACKHVPNLL